MHDVRGASTSRGTGTAAVVLATAVMFGSIGALAGPAGAASRTARPVAHATELVHSARSAVIVPTRPISLNRPLPEPTVDGRLVDPPPRPPTTRSASASTVSVPKSQWRVKPTPSPLTRQGDLFNVSCSKPTRCTAVGRYTDSQSFIHVLVERWNGHKWNVQRVPEPFTAYATFLSDVSCPTATACMAVGQWFDIDTGFAYNLAERWDGHSWIPTQTVDVAGSQLDALDSVSCTAPDACTAVGYYQDSADIHPLALRWDGTTWSGQPLPATPGVAGPLFEDVSCSTATDCTAVGRAYTDHTIMLAGTWDGTSWTLRTIPNSGVTSDLDSVSCTAPDACIAVGMAFDATSTYSVPLAVAWNGADWTVQTIPGNPLGNYDSALYTVSCRSSASCVATGYHFDAAHFHPFAETWDGSAWTVREVPQPDDALAATVYGVSCTGPTMCTTVGYYYAPTYETVTLAESGDGASWSIEGSRNPVSAFSSAFFAISCSSTSACTAVGSTTTGEPWDEALAERWNGARWSIESLPAPSGFGTHLTGVSCSADDACTAVGFRKLDANGATTALVAETWDGTGWTERTVPEPAGMVSGQFEGVSCSAPDACTAVGYSFDSADSESAFAERWDGDAWTLQSVVEPGATQNELRAVSCVSVSSCVAVGEYVSSDADPNGLTLVEVWDGTAWTVQDSPNPTGVANALDSVSCTSTAMCVAAGENHDDSGFVSNLVEAWDGTGWTVQPTPNQSTSNSFTGVSCTTASSCTAVGRQAEPPSGLDYTFAEVWNGSRWKVQPMRDWGFVADLLGGVSCVGAKCFAAGAQVGPSGIPLTLVEERG